MSLFLSGKPFGLKNYVAVDHINEVHLLWMLIDQNHLVYIGRMNRVITARFLRSWPLKAQIDWITNGNIWSVRKKSQVERMVAAAQQLSEAGCTVEDIQQAGKIIYNALNKKNRYEKNLYCFQLEESTWSSDVN